MSIDFHQRPMQILHDPVNKHVFPTSKIPLSQPSQENSTCERHENSPQPNTLDLASYSLCVFAIIALGRAPRHYSIYNISSKSSYPNQLK